MVHRTEHPRRVPTPTPLKVLMSLGLSNLSLGTTNSIVNTIREEINGTHLEASKERRGIRGGPGRGRLIGGPVTQLMLIVGKDL